MIYSQVELVKLEGVEAEVDVGYIPKPNIVDVVLSRKLAPLEVIPTAFSFPFLKDGRIVLAMNARRGAEVPGGHRDPIPGTHRVLETPESTAIRETLEETGTNVTGLIAVGFMRSISTGVKPDGYKYPFPYSCQQFFTGWTTEPGKFVENDECLRPIIVKRKNIEKHLKGRGLALYHEAYRLMFG